MFAPTAAQREFAKILTSNAFVNAVTAPTRNQHDSASLIDVYITNIEDPNVASGTIGINISDHLHIIFNDRPYRNEAASTKPRHNIPFFCKELATISWEDVDVANDPDIAYEAFLTHFTLVYKKHFPRKHLRVRQSRKP